MRIGMIGCGRHAASVHGPSQREYAAHNPDTILAACCDLNSECAHRYSVENGFDHYYTSWEKMIDKEKLDAVCIVLPPQFLAKVATPLLRMGLPVLMEKPPCLNGTDLNGLIDAASEGGGIHQVGFNRRYVPLLVEAIRTMNAEIPPEKVIQIQCDLVRYQRSEPDFEATAIHSIDTALFLARSPFITARFQFRELTELGAGVASVTLNATCESDTRVLCNFHPVSGTVLERIAVHAIDHTLLLELPMWNGPDFPGVLRYWKKDKLARMIRGSELEGGNELYKYCGFYGETVAFLNAVRHGKHAAPTLEDCRSQVSLMEHYRARTTENIELLPKYECLDS